MLKKLLTVAVVCGLLVCAVGAWSASYTFKPADADLEDLPHGSLYMWGVSDWILPSNEQIVSAKLTIHNIYDNILFDDDHLYIHLLDTAVGRSGMPDKANWHSAITNGKSSSYKRITKEYCDSNWIGDSNRNGDNFAGQGIELGTWSDPDGWFCSDTISFDVPMTSLSWLSDGDFGIGIDPDCHYNNCGVDFTITTSVQPDVPEPMSFVLASLGLSAIVGTKRLRKK
ncbi:MAG: hypothetical protein ABFD54_17765 [Armatimonadota bacterium]|nr:hypothetical protein [bacterium]